MVTYRKGSTLSKPATRKGGVIPKETTTTSRTRGPGRFGAILAKEGVTASTPSTTRLPDNLADARDRASAARVTGGTGGAGGAGGAGGSASSYYANYVPGGGAGDRSGTADNYGSSDLARFTEQDIAAALRAIEAEFGLTEAELLRDKSMIGAEYRLLTAQLARAQENALEGAEAGALQRGLFRSGIFAEEVGEIAGEFAEQQNELARGKQTSELDIESQLLALEANKAAAKAAQETAIRREEYTARLSAAGL